MKGKMGKLNLPEWNLDAIYPDDSQWEVDFGMIRTLAAHFAAYRGRLSESPSILEKAFAALDAFKRLGEKVYMYARLRSDENTADSTNLARLNRVCALLADLSETSSWFEPEIMAIPETQMTVYLKSDDLQLYRRSLLELLRQRPHILTEPEEKILGAFSEILTASEDIFGMMNDADMDFGQLKDSNGKRIHLTHGSYRRLMEDSDREIRKRTFRKLHESYRKQRNTFAATLATTVKQHVISAKTRHHTSALAAALFQDQIPEDVYHNLISTVHERLKDLHGYLKLRCDVLKLKQLDMYDLYNPLLPEHRCDYTWQEALDTVRQALRPLGDEYIAALNLAEQQHWLDAPERRGKRSGAYSSGCYDTYPYILLNFNGTLNDVFTIAHEIGHSLHSFFSNKSQHYHYADYSIFVAEVASTTNEILLFEHLLNQSSCCGMRPFLLCHLADEIRTTIYRQTMFAEFELIIHRLTENQTPLTADLLDDTYYALNAKYHGDVMAADRLIACEWERIPHFYYNFYVYKYATGMSAAIRLADKILHGTTKDRNCYLNFLRAGGSKNVLDIMRDAGVDLSTPEPIQSALNYFQQTVRELRVELVR